MDSAFPTKPFPGHSLADLKAAIMAGSDNPKMLDEIARREAILAGELSRMMPNERLATLRQRPADSELFNVWRPSDAEAARFDWLEIEPQRRVDDYAEACDAADADCVAVFGHYRPGSGSNGRDCLTDAATMKRARAIAKYLGVFWRLNVKEL